MTWTYHGPHGAGDPALSTLYQVRYLVGDTDTSEQLASDEEIAWQLTENPNVRLAAAEVADAIALQFSRQATLRSGDTSVDYTARAKQYATLAKQLRQRAGLRGAIPYAGGLSLAERDTNAAKADRVQPAFTRTLGDFSGEGPQSSDSQVWP